MSKTITWSGASVKDHKLAKQIAVRANNEIGDINATCLHMDIIAIHLNGCKLKLKELLEAPLNDFLHDIGGINQHIDRDTGQLQDCFLPRYAL